MAKRVTGGHRLKALIGKARAAKAAAPKGVEAGFYSTSRYPDGTPMTNVAAWNEFGTRGGGWGGPIPERPFMRNAAREMPRKVLPVLKAQVDPKTLAVDRVTAGHVGNVMKTMIQQEIRDLREPPNSPRTIELKGSSNPLIDTGALRQSVTFKTIE